jgi:hypothetical protein
MCRRVICRKFVSVLVSLTEISDMRRVKSMTDIARVDEPEPGFDQLVSTVESASS